MGRKVFISYKYNDYMSLSIKYRDELIKKLKGEGDIYKGEDGYSDDISDLKADTIKTHLKKMIHDTTVTIVLITPNITSSDWVDWEISYSLKDVTRQQEGRSRMNGVIGVICPDNNGKLSYVKQITECDTVKYLNEKIPTLISENRYNIIDKSTTKKSDCGTIYDRDLGSYCSIYIWDDFVNDIENKIEIAYEKSRKLSSDYNIVKEIQ